MSDILFALVRIYIYIYILNVNAGWAYQYGLENVMPQFIELDVIVV